ncbi:MAG: hypothetical protein ACXAC8_18725 [Candidatus Hodarchaeales archaeon]|jgi:hypothetical protein
MMDLKFDKEKVKQAEEEYNQLKLDPAQRGMVDAMAQGMLAFVPVSETAVKGFTWKVMTQWQKENERTMANLHTASLEEQIEATKQMIAISKKIYLRLLWNATPQQKKTLEMGFDGLLEKSIEVMKSGRR